MTDTPELIERLNGLAGHLNDPADHDTLADAVSTLQAQERALKIREWAEWIIAVSADEEAETRVAARDGAGASTMGGELADA